MRQIGPCSILWVEFDYRAPTDEAALSLFGSLLCPYWRESEAQLTEKQVVLLMHDIYKEHWLHFVYREIFIGKPNPTYFDLKISQILLKN